MKSAWDRLREFYSGKCYPLVIAFLAILANATGQEFLFYLLAALTFFAGCWIAYDFRFALPIFLCTLFFPSYRTIPDVTSVRTNYATPFAITMLAICFSLIGLGIVLFVLRNRRRANRFPWKGMLLTLAFLCVAFCLNGILNSDYTVMNLLYALTFPGIIMLTYVLFALFINFDEHAFEHLMYCLVVACTVICVELIIRYLSGGVIVNGAIVKENVTLGWAIWTTIGGMIAFFMPATFYFAATRRHGWCYYLLGLFQFFCTVLSQSRGAMLVGAAVTALSIGILCFFGRNKKSNRIMTLSCLVVGACGILLLWNKILAVMQNFIDYGFGDNGRFELWKTAFSRFLSNPIFGAGFYDHGIDSPWDIQIYPKFYHNTILQVLASTGIVGMAAYLFHRVKTVLRVVLKPSLYKTYLGICILSCLLFCMLDVLLFITYPLITYTLLVLFIEQRGEYEDKAAIYDPML